MMPKDTSKLPYLYTDEYFMQIAIKEAQKAYKIDEVPIGAIIVLDNKIISKAHNQIQKKKDATKHAELIAINKAIKVVGEKFLTDCTLFVTLEPCSMCAGAIVLSRLKRVVIGAKDEKAGACGSVENIAANMKLNHRAELEFGILGAECSELLSRFFRELREKKKKYASN